MVASIAILVAFWLSGRLAGQLSLNLLGIDRGAYLEAFAQEGRSTQESLLRRIEDNPSVAKRFLYEIAMLGAITWGVQVVYVIVGATVEWVGARERSV
jgi:hypothetical protein